MKKQTKVFATLSAAALLAVGVSAVSMAAGWDNSTGVWRYLDNNGEAVTDTWKSANGNWFYLDSDGVMATNQLIEDTNNSKTRYYYVDQYGAMVTNTWKAVAMDDASNTDLDAEYWWYYFGADGKAYTSEDDLTTSEIKTINGLKYAFDDEGHMLYGWIDKDNVDQQDDNDSAWENATYYFNGWNDGHMQTGWIKLAVEDDDDTEEYWFYFDNKGKKQFDKRKKINGLYYHFGEKGNMLDDWAAGTSDELSGATAASLSYLNGDGSERRNKWVWAIPDEDYLEKDYNDDEYSWWYFNKSGKLTSNEIKKIGGKKYAFDEYGRMLTQFVAVDSNGHPYDLGDTDDWSRDQWIAGANDDDVNTGWDYIYYFSSDEEKDGSMKKGYQNLALDDGDYQFYFNTSNGRAEEGSDGSTDPLKKGYVSKIKKYVWKGLVLAPGSDDPSNYMGVDVYGTKKVYFGEDAVGCVLVGKSGTVVKNKKKLKDENDAYYVVSKDGVVLAYYPSSDDYDDDLTYTDAKGNDKKISVDSKWLETNDPDTYQSKRAAAVAAKQGK
ncbi:Putative cell wall binding repeat-containing protein [Oribacterium sp. KHPX15]|uniref:hypothetical protein n=1 Tax=Oribacterium sp. KHPX15 TaxID=1855342 RepID=UPI0008945D45|nr:hypothetical protein [Oribacterium sp. KHPX15]SEA56973.1 Putative cell wall binding repeat-containing protein [Oribacterium sp. KHPX15]